MADQERFLADCWTIVRALGKEDPTIAKRARTAWGLRAEGARCYQDRIIEIVAEAEPSKRLVATELKFRHPLVLTASDGTPSQWGPSFDKYERPIHMLALSLQEDED
jgi:hypothetical protein